MLPTNIGGDAGSANISHILGRLKALEDMYSKLSRVEVPKKSFFGEWTDYTVIWTASTTNPSLGNGSLPARYCQIGKTVHYVAKLAIGSTTSKGSGNWEFSIPVPVVSGEVNYLGSWRAYDNGAHYGGSVTLPAGNTFINRFTRDGFTTTLDATTPFSWTSGDILYFGLTYEAA